MCGHAPLSPSWPFLSWGCEELNAFVPRLQGKIIVVLLTEPSSGSKFLSKRFRSPMTFPHPCALIPIFILLMGAFFLCYLQQEPVDPVTSFAGVKRNSNQSFRKSSSTQYCVREKFSFFCTSFPYLLITAGQRKV